MHSLLLTVLILLCACSGCGSSATALNVKPQDIEKVALEIPGNGSTLYLVVDGEGKTYCGDSNEDDMYLLSRSFEKLDVVKAIAVKMVASDCSTYYLQYDVHEECNVRIIAAGKQKLIYFRNDKSQTKMPEEFETLIFALSGLVKW